GARRRWQRPDDRRAAGEPGAVLGTRLGRERLDRGLGKRQDRPRRWVWSRQLGSVGDARGQRPPQPAPLASLVTGWLVALLCRLARLTHRRPYRCAVHS